ncbi:MAG TPA: methionyl-tRNA formyltransferase [Candidatus Sulfotelmatobacter sp.]|nr:methionyl-tRNA formyltransferase [Candidatus Sulfotelmatobacter sp.]
MNRLRMVFCGTPQFAVPSLQRLISEPDFEITAVFTQPDRPRGRGQEISSSPVKMAALAAQIPVYQPPKIRAPEIERQLREQAPEVIVIIAYGQIIPVRLLDVPKHGWINLHASLLPKYRGAAPIHWAIANGEKVTGNTSMHIDAGMDTGEILLQQEMPIGPEETAPELSARLSEAGAELMVATLRGLVAGQIAPRPQNHAAATYAPMLKREDGWIDWARTAQEIYNRVRGFAPWPGAYTEFRGQMCHVWGRPGVGSGSNEPPGTIVAQDGKLKVTCGAATVLELTHVKLEGRRQVTAAEFANGARLLPGERLGKS